MQLALFDLVNTLLTGDSDSGWISYLVDQGILDRQTFEQQNAVFFAQLLDGPGEKLHFGFSAGQDILGHGGHAMGAQTVDDTKPLIDVTIGQKDAFFPSQSLNFYHRLAHQVSGRLVGMQETIGFLLDGHGLIHTGVEHQLAPAVAKDILRHIPGQWGLIK